MIEMETEDEFVCRTCLQIYSSDQVSLLSQTVDNIEQLSLMEKLLLSIPQLTVDIVHEPVVCHACGDAISQLYQFVSICIESEKTLYQYIKRRKKLNLLKTADLLKLVKGDVSEDSYSSTESLSLSSSPASTDDSASQESQKLQIPTSIQSSLDAIVKQAQVNGQKIKGKLKIKTKAERKQLKTTFVKDIHCDLGPLEDDVFEINKSMEEITSKQDSTTKRKRESSNYGTPTRESKRIKIKCDELEQSSTSSSSSSTNKSLDKYRYFEESANNNSKQEATRKTTRRIKPTIKAQNTYTTNTRSKSKIINKKKEQANVQWESDADEVLSIDVSAYIAHEETVMTSDSFETSTSDTNNKLKGGKSENKSKVSSPNKNVSEKIWSIDISPETSKSSTANKIAKAVDTSPGRKLKSTDQVNENVSPKASSSDKSRNSRQTSRLELERYFKNTYRASSANKKEKLKSNAHRVSSPGKNEKLKNNGHQVFSPDKNEKLNNAQQVSTPGKNEKVQNNAHQVSSPGKKEKLKNNAHQVSSPGKKEKLKNNAHQVSSPGKKAKVQKNVHQVSSPSLNKSSRTPRTSKTTGSVKRNQSLNKDEEVANKIKRKTKTFQFSSNFPKIKMREKDVPEKIEIVNYTNDNNSNGADYDFVDINQPSTSSSTRTRKKGKGFPCEMCTKKFDYKSQYQVHLKSHILKKLFMCKVCGKHFAQQKYLNMHSALHADVTGMYQCEICNKSLSASTALKRHLRTHTGEKPYPCNQCCKRFTQKIQLEIHNRTHTGQKPFKCDACDTTFAQKSHLTGHVRIHTGEKPYKCDICPKAFRKSYALRVHEESHNKNPYQCEICNYLFKDVEVFEKHIKKHTSGNQKLKNIEEDASTSITRRGYYPGMTIDEIDLNCCEVCQRHFTTKFSLKRHIRIMHNIDI